MIRSKNIDILNLLKKGIKLDVQNAIFSELPTVPLIEKPKKTETTLFGVVRQIISNSKSWQKTLTKACKICAVIPDKTMWTNCFVNQIALNLLFIGEEKTKKLHEAITYTVASKREISTNHGKKPVYLLNLFSGNNVLHLNRESPLHAHVEEDYENTVKKFLSSIQHIAFSAEPKFDRSFFGHNENVFHRLTSEIAINEKTISLDSSIIYSISITTPNPEAVKHGTIDKIRATTLIFHAFILEQYLGQDENTVFIRLHNSWVHRYSLSHFYELKKYNNSDKGCFSPEATKIFLRIFGNMLCCGDFDLKKLNEYQNACFEVPDHWPPPELFTSRTNEGIFTGTSLRYITSKINPIELTAKLQSTDLLIA